MYTDIVQGLLVILILQVQGSPIYKPSTFWTADNNIQNARQATNDANLNGVTTTSWWCNNGGGGVAGIAYLGALCHPYAVNLNEYQSTKNAAGFVSFSSSLY